ncbi:hypothetical protein [Nannocystis pusilla]|uniref:hypothetical protein n=1 Tax=Nannocystis pusilla TaxID=889268 RepID=UPI003B8098DE
MQPPSGDNGKKSLHGPMGLVVDGERLLLANQNINESSSGEIRSYDRFASGVFDVLIASTQKSAPERPYAPRGLVVQGSILYVADVGDAGAKPPAPGRLTTWDAETGEFLGDLGLDGYAHPFRPRGLVFGPDGFLYVSVTALPNRGYGAIVRFDPDSGVISDIVYECDPAVDPDCELHRPEGVVFGPDGRLYVASFQLDAADVDRILIFDVAAGDGPPVDAIELFQPGQSRAFAQALLFGPDDGLYVPISGGGPDVGSVRIYDVVDKSFDLLVAPRVDGGPLAQPFFLTFGNTNPETLAYEPALGCD